MQRIYNRICGIVRNSPELKNPRSTTLSHLEQLNPVNQLTSEEINPQSTNQILHVWPHVKLVKTQWSTKVKSQPSQRPPRRGDLLAMSWFLFKSQNLHLTLNPYSPRLKTSYLLLLINLMDKVYNFTSPQDKMLNLKSIKSSIWPQLVHIAKGTKTWHFFPSPKAKRWSQINLRFWSCPEL